MWPYWMMFILPASAALLEAARRPHLMRGQDVTTNIRLPRTWWFVMAALTLLVGWRHQVGGDWFNYLDNFQNSIYDSQFGVWWENDPGYHVLEWLGLQTGWGIYFVNLMAASIFSLGLVMFCWYLPRPWLGLAVAVPYLVVVVAMGYSRQGVAVGLAMLGMLALQRQSVRGFVLLVVLGATFHKSAVLLLPIAALASNQNRFGNTVWVALATLVAYYLLLADSLEGLVTNYVEAQYQSEGALVRLVMNAVPAVFLLRFGERFGFRPSQVALWRWLAMISLVLLAMYFVTNASTALDRVALFMLPLQILVFAHLPEVLGHPRTLNKGWVALVVLYYGVVLFVWLNFAVHAEYWIPYRFYPLEGMF